MFLKAGSRGGSGSDATRTTATNMTGTGVPFVDQVAANLQRQRDQFRGRGLPTRK